MQVLPLLPALPVLGFDEVVSHVADKFNCAWRHRHIAFQDILKVLWCAKVDLSVVPVLAHAGAVEVNAGKQALVALVAQQLSVHLPVSGGLAGAAHRSGRSRSVAPDFEFVLQEILKSAVVYGHQDEVSGLAANLEAERSARHADEDGRTPSMAGAAGYHALPVLRAEYERALHHARNHGDAGGGVQNIQWNRAVLRREDLVKNRLCRVDAIL